MNLNWTSMAIGAAIGYLILPSLLGKEVKDKAKS